MIFWRIVKKVFGLEHPSYYLGSLNFENAEEMERKESQAA